MIERIVGVFAIVLCTNCANGVSPDTIILNAKVFTANPAQPWAQAIAITGERIVAVGDAPTIRATAGSATRRIDAGGRTIIPGLNDAHQHIGVTPPNDRLAMPFDPSLAQIAEALALQLSSSPPGRLITGEIAQSAWGDPKFDRAWVDAIAPDHPVWLFSFTGHGALLNSRGLALVDLTDAVNEIDGGRYGRGADGRLNGRLEEYAGFLISRRLALKSDRADSIASLRRFAADARGFGITSAQLMSTTWPAPRIASDLVDANLPLRWRVYRFPVREAGGETVDGRPVLPPQPSPLIDMRGMKWILDGTPVERLATVRAPYHDAPSETGRLNFPQERIDQWVGWAYGSEDPLAVHAVGDAAIDAYLSAAERAGRAEVWRTKRPRIEHGDMLAPDLIPRAKALGMVVIQNPLHFMLAPVLGARLGPERMAWMQPMKSLLDAGIPIAIGSDGPMNPFLNIMAATTHPANPKEALTREQAVTAYTAGSAFAEFKEKEKGQIAVGMLADLAILSADVFTVPVGQMEAIRSVMTIFGGRVVHDIGAVH